MKIAFFVTEFPALSETFIINQIIGLKNTGHTVHIYSQVPPSTKMIHQSVLDSNLFDSTSYLNVIPFSRAKKIRKLLRLLLLNVNNRNNLLIFKNIFKKESNLSVYNLIPFLDHKTDYDVVHAHFGVNGNFVLGLRKLGMFKRAKFTTSFHGYDLNEAFSNRDIYNSLFEMCKSFTVNSQYSQGLLEKIGAPKNNICLIQVGVDLNKFNKINNIENVDKPIKLLFVGRLVKFKAPDRFVQICNLLKSKGLIFSATIVGDGIMLDEIIKMVRDYNLETEITIAEAKTQEEIVDIMDNHDIFVYPGITYNNRAENQGLVIQEAQAMKLPVIISDAGGMQEGIQNNITGFVVKEDNLIGFVEKILLLENNRGLIRKMGEEGRKFVIKNYDIEKLNDKLIKIYLN